MVQLFVKTMKEGKGREGKGKGVKEYRIPETIRKYIRIAMWGVQCYDNFFRSLLPILISMGRVLVV